MDTNVVWPHHLNFVPPCACWPRQVTLRPDVKLHLTEGIYRILDLCKEQDIKFLTAGLQMGVREVFNELYSSYTHYHKAQRQGEDKYTVWAVAMFRFPLDSIRINVLDMERLCVQFLLFNERKLWDILNWDCRLVDRMWCLNTVVTGQNCTSLLLLWILHMNTIISKQTYNTAASLK